MSPLTRNLLAAAAAVLVTAPSLWYLQRHRAIELGRLRAANDRLRFEAVQRRSRPSSAPARPASVRTEQREVQHLAVADAPPAGARAADVYRDEGQATPLATLQTLAWACDCGETQRVRQLIQLDGRAREKAETYFASVADGTGRWQTVDDMAAAALTYQGMTQPYPFADVLATATPDPKSPERVVLHLPNTLRAVTEYQKVGDSWRFVITEAMVDRYLARVAEQPPGVR